MPTYTPLQSIELTSASASITFSGIPQTYQDLVLVASIAGVSAATDPWIRINSDTGTNYSWTWLAGNGGAVYSEKSGGSDTKLYYSAISQIQNNVHLIQFNFMNYSNTTTFKKVLWRESDASTESGATIGLWRSTSAINTIEISLDSSRTYSAGSTFDLYGISPVAADTAQAFGGTDIYYDSTYVYHVFKGSGTFTPYRNLTCDYLVVAGGGGGGFNHGGGGGAGGLKSTVGATGGGGSLESALSLTASTNYTVTVGAGGAGATSAGAKGSDGSNSVFSTITSTGGGGGGSEGVAVRTGATGGSGGGGRLNTASSGGAGTANQGFAGGTAAVGTGAGGGGGAGAAGQNGIDGAGSNLTGGVGGNGVQITALATPTITGADSGYYAGGGGGAGEPAGQEAAGGLGGGGAGKAISGTVGGAATTNTGGGGGGSGDTAAGGAGGSGLVIIRYAR